jgi:uncharacterized protein involved in exopolysaccharide biosynthesis
MPDIFYLISKWWKQILVVVLLSLLASAIITFLKPRQYLSVATAVPASVVATDKSRIFSGNIESLYSNLGSPDDLDMMVGTAELDTVYLAVTDQFNLFDHYKISNGKNIRRKTAELLKKYTRVMKSGYGELQVKVWDTDKDLAPQLANAIMSKLEAIHRGLQNANNQQALQSLQKTIREIQINIDSINILHNSTVLTEQTAEPYAIHRKVLLSRLEEYQKLAGEYQLLINSGSEVLLVVEKARPAAWPDKPDWVKIMIAVTLLSLLFALLVALVMEKRKTALQP